MGPTRPTLAIDGGAPVRPADRPWSAWPRYTDGARREVDAVLARGAGRAISGPWTGEQCPRATLRGAGRGITGWTHAYHHEGSARPSSRSRRSTSAPATEVIVHGLTWVANASAVLRANASPSDRHRSRDVVPVGGGDATRAVGPRTRAICVVHLYSSMAEMDGLRTGSRGGGRPARRGLRAGVRRSWRGAGQGTRSARSASSACSRAKGADGRGRRRGDHRRVRPCRRLEQCVRRARVLSPASRASESSSWSRSAR